jgi:hypothetical protein
MPVNTLTAVIEAGQSLSASVDAASGGVIQLTTPSAWTPANLTFQVSVDGTDYDDLYTVQGQELMIGCEPDRAIAVNASEWPALRFLKLRSGTADAPVPQSERREFGVVIDTTLARRG